MITKALQQPASPRKPMLRLDPSGERPAMPALPAAAARLSFVPEHLPDHWQGGSQAPVALRQARALSDDERLAAAAMYLWLRNRAEDSAIEGPLVLLCDRQGQPATGELDGPRSLGGALLDQSVMAAMNADR